MMGAESAASGVWVPSGNRLAAGDLDVLVTAAEGPLGLVALASGDCSVDRNQVKADHLTGRAISR
jgi:hypothetical protein